MTLRSLLKIGWSHRCDSISEPPILFHSSIFISLPNCVCSSLSILSTNGITSISRKRLLPLKKLLHVLQKYMKSHQLGPEPLILQWAMRFITQMPWIIPSNSLKTLLIWWMVTRTSLETTPDWRPPQVLSSQGPVQVSAPHSGQHPAGSQGPWARAESHRHSCAAGSTQPFQPLSLQEDPLLLLTLQWEAGSPVNQLLSADPNQSCEKEKQGLYFPSLSNRHETRFSKVTVRNTKTRTSWLLGLCSPGASRSRYETDRHMSRKQLPKKSSTANNLF